MRIASTPKPSTTVTEHSASSSANPTPARPSDMLSVAAAPTPSQLEKVTGTRPSLTSKTPDDVAQPPNSIVAVRAAGNKTPVQRDALRFAKHNGVEVEFPLTPEGAKALQGSNAVSPFLPDNPRVLVPPTLLAPPTHPGDKGYWNELESVVDAQLARLRGGNVEEVLGKDRVPKLFQGHSLAEAAAAVHTDLPSDWPTALLRQFIEEGAKIDPQIVPQLSGTDFVNSIVTANGVLSMAPAAVSPAAFACKWHEGRARPEEVVWAIARGDITEVPASLKAKVESLKLDSPESFTAYPEGAPRHPAWPAMHSAASISSIVLPVLFDLTPEQLQEARNMDFAVSSFRTVAGVHFETDNIAGLQIGQMAIEKWLPDFLAQYAGADPDAVRAKIAKVRYDWSQHAPLNRPG